MRITGGAARGIPLGTGRARQIRPATDRMREAVFSSLGGRVTGVSFLDLFAGTGSYGLEALSRGATGGTFVEKNAPAAAALRENLGAVLKSLGNPANLPVRILRADATRFHSEAGFRLVFMDPPYELARSRAAELLERAKALLEPEGVLVFECPPTWPCPQPAGPCCVGSAKAAPTNRVFGSWRWPASSAFT
ncbi:MAG: RsmD family RNA methyltransferase, partial [Oceanipulchritudo sp.]